MNTYEKKYKEALSKAKDMLSYKEVRREDMEYLFPELAENDDGWVRKNLIELFHDTVSNDEIFSDYGLDKTEVLAWLEKQGTSYTKRDVDDAFVEGMAFAKNELEKQGQVKESDIPQQEEKTCKENDNSLTSEQRVEEAMRELEEKSKVYMEAHKGETADEFIARCQGEQKQEIKLIFPKFRVGDRIFKTHNSDINKCGIFPITKITEQGYWYNESVICAINEEDEWELVEWSEEDESIMKGILQLCTCADFLGIAPDPISKIRNWLKSLKDRLK